MAGENAGVVFVPWYATGFRADRLEAAVNEVAPTALRYGATSYHVYRYREDRYKFLHLSAFTGYDDFVRWWDGEEMIEFRARHSGWYQVPLLYSWADLTATGELEVPQPVTAARGSGAPQGDTI